MAQVKTHISYKTITKVHKKNSNGKLLSWFRRKQSGLSMTSYLRFVVLKANLGCRKAI